MLGVRYALLLAGILASTIHGTAAAQETVPAQAFPSAPQPGAEIKDAAPTAPPPSVSPSSTDTAPASARTPSAPASSAPAPVATENSPGAAASATSPLVSEPSTPKRLPNWNIGAGIGYSGGDSAAYVGYLSEAPNTPSYRVGFERRIHRGCWLAFTGSFMHASYDTPVSSQLDPPTRTTLNAQTTTAAALLGIRQALITDIVEFSWYGAAAGAWSWSGGDMLEEGEVAQGAPPGGSARTLGFRSGISIERQLIDRLAVRLTSEILSLEWSKWTAGQTYEQSIGEEPPPITHHSQSTLLHVAPAIDLRFYF